MQKVVITDYFKEPIIEQNIFGEKVSLEDYFVYYLSVF